ncbi:MAG: hypothetical protein Q4D14_03750 [Bacteroidales bacterium]|nr:hypothetical protein [Bacteroidales bacterium]
MPLFSTSNKRLLLLIGICLCFSLLITAQTNYPTKEGDKVRYEMQIEFRQANLSGICLLNRQNDIVKSSLVNEFGVSLMDFSYNELTKKIKILHLTKKLDRIAVRQLLKHDLPKVLNAMQEGNSSYNNKKYNITYTFSHIKNSEE